MSGYTSQSEMWVAGQRLKRWIENKQIPIIYHFGDHDPSGLDMTRDIIDRLRLFMGGVRLERLALNMDQIEAYKPPPNPTKITDSRADGYVRQYGHESWELDALPPAVLAGLVRDSVIAIRDDGRWKQAFKQEIEHRRLLEAVSDKWSAITKKL